MLKLLETAEFRLYTGGGKDGIFRLLITKKNVDWEYRIFDFIQYESSYEKNIIIAVGQMDLERARAIYDDHSYTDSFLRPHEQKVLMHTTSKENHRAIMNDGQLKSWNLLKKQGIVTEDAPIGHLLGDPPDYSDYIMFSSGGVGAERVVSSRQKQTIEMDVDVLYTAGARFYFDAEKIANDGLLVRDGAHLKVKDSLAVGKYVLWIATPAILDKSENTTPRAFAEKADAVFTEKTGINLTEGA